MPVGIQMFATITSKDHVRHIQQDLQNMYFSDTYRDTVLHCADGSIYLSRLLTGLLFPFLKPSRCFQFLDEATLILPEHNKLEIEKSIFNLLGIKYSDQSQESGASQPGHHPEWPKDIDKIIGTLHPGTPIKGREKRAVLHSEVLQETAVIHAASTDDETDESLKIVDAEPDSEWHPHQDDGRRIHKKLKVQHYQHQNKRKAEILAEAAAAVAVNNHQPGEASSVSSRRTTVVEMQHQQQIETAHPQYIHPEFLGDSNVVLPTPQFLCTLCNALFEDQAKFEIHIKQNHNLYKCNKCDATFKKQRDLLDHGRVHSGHKLIRCDICDKDFTERGLLWHTERFHKVGALDSSKPMKKRGVKMESVATTPIQTKPETVPHTSPQPQQKEQQQSSPADAPTPQPLPDSQSNAQSPPPVPSSEKEMEKEEGGVYPKNNVYFSSDESDTESQSPNKTSDKHSPLRKTRSKEKVKEHKSDDASASKPQPPPPRSENGAASASSSAVVGATGQTSGKKSNLRKLFSCSYCHKKFSYNSSMRVHEKVHLGGKPYHCDMCDAKFSNKFDLYTHEKEHSDQRPHKCDMCQETFKTEENLRFHKMIHSASEPITCKYCNKYFQTKHQLAEHEKIHTGPFKCKECGISYDKAAKLTTHMKSKHSKDAPTPR